MKRKLRIDRIIATIFVAFTTIICIWLIASMANINACNDIGTENYGQVASWNFFNSLLDMMERK